MTKWLAHVSVASCRTISYGYIGATLHSSTTATHLDLVLEEPGIFFIGSLRNRSRIDLGSSMGGPSWRAYQITSSVKDRKRWSASSR